MLRKAVSSLRGHLPACLAAAEAHLLCSSSGAIPALCQTQHRSVISITVQGNKARRRSACTVHIIVKVFEQLAISIIISLPDA